MKLLKSSLITAIASLVVFIPNARAFTEHTASIGQLAVQHDTAVKHGELAGATFGYASQKVTAPVVPAVVAPAEQAPSTPAISQECGDNADANFIYSHESGCRLTATNEIGCIGIGQSCGGSLEKACPNWRTDYICQNNFFTEHSKRYGGWSGSREFWESRRWW